MGTIKSAGYGCFLQHKQFIKIFWFLTCFLVALLVRIYTIDVTPYGIHADEAGMGYDAWCLQKYHVDRWLNSFPVYLTNFGGGGRAPYMHICVPHLLKFLEKVTGILRC